MACFWVACHIFFFIILKFMSEKKNSCQVEMGATERKKMLTSENDIIKDELRAQLGNGGQHNARRKYEE